MHKRLVRIALCCPLLALVGCRHPATIMVAVDPNFGVFNYAHIGDTLTFRPLNPKAGDFWVIFDNPSPCSAQEYEIKTGVATSCVVVNQVDSYQYYVSPTRKEEEKFAAGPRSCPQCQFIVIPAPKVPKSPPPTTPAPSASNALAPASSAGAAPPIPLLIGVHCASGTPTVKERTITQNDAVAWDDADDDTNTVTITMPSGVCSGTATYTNLQACTLTGTPGRYPYNVQAQGCDKSGTGYLTIAAPSSSSQ
jgi:hypothetical protein